MKAQIIKKLKTENLKSVAEELNLTPYKLKKLAEENNISIPKKRKENIVFKVIKELLLDKNQSITEIGNRFGVSRQRVHQIKKNCQMEGIIK